MKLNKTNRFLIGIAIMLMGLVLYRWLHYQPWNRYYYFSTICAPASYPVYVRDAYFVSSANGESSYINNNDVNFFNTAWKAWHYFPEAHDKELLPDKLVLKYASYRDRLFYRDTIDLPGDTIRLLGDALLRNNGGMGIYYHGRDIKGLGFLVGIANNGYILVWLKGNKDMHLVLRQQIQPVAPTADDTYYNESMAPDAYLEDRFMGLDDSLKARIDAGWDVGAHYKDSL